MRIKFPAVLAASLALCTVPAGAQGPEVETYGDVRVWSGGMGTDEREAMAARAEDFDVKLVLSRAPEGAFEADVNVSIEREGEPVLEVGGVGPWVFLDLPAGTFTVVAESRGETIRKDVEVDGSGIRQVPIRFTEPEVENETRRPAPTTEAESSITTIERRESTREYEVPADQR